MANSSKATAADSRASFARPSSRLDPRGVAAKSQPFSKDRVGSVPALLRQACEHVLGAKELASMLRSLSRTTLGGLRYTDLHECVEAAVKSMRFERSRELRLIRHYAEIPSVLCNPGLLGHVLVNILCCALQARQGACLIAISTNRQGDDVVVTVRDRCLRPQDFGLDDLEQETMSACRRLQAREFGVAVSQCIVARHGGRLEVEVTKRGDTEVRVFLPMHSEPFDSRELH